MASDVDTWARAGCISRFNLDDRKQTRTRTAGTQVRVDPEIETVRCRLERSSLRCFHRAYTRPMC